MMENLEEVLVGLKERAKTIGYKVFVVCISIHFGFFGFLLGLSYPVWLFAITLIMVNPFQKKEKFETTWTKLEDFFLTYYGISALIAILYYMMWDDPSTEPLNHFATIDTMRHDLLNHPMFIVHTLCSFFGTIAYIRSPHIVLRTKEKQ